MSYFYRQEKIREGDRICLSSVVTSDTQMSLFGKILGKINKINCYIYQNGEEGAWAQSKRENNDRIISQITVDFPNGFSNS